MEAVEINAIRETGCLAAGAACMADDAREMILTDDDVFGGGAGLTPGEVDPSPATDPATYSIGGRSLTRQNEAEIRESITLWDEKAKTLTRPRTFTREDIGGIFSAGFLDETQCRHWILTAIHGEGPDTCPACHTALTTPVLQRFWKGRRVCCRACGKFFTARTGTFLDGCHMGYREVILLAVFLHFKIHPREIARILRISPETVRLWEIKFAALQRMNGMG